MPWILFHKVLGISHFFLFVEGQAAKPKNAAILQSMEVGPLADKMSLTLSIAAQGGFLPPE